MPSDSILSGGFGRELFQCIPESGLPQATVFRSPIGFPDSVRVSLAFRVLLETIRKAPTQCTHHDSEFRNKKDCPDLHDRAMTP
jgi:hypothetical protein